MIVPAQALRLQKPIKPWHERTRHNGMTFGCGPAGYDVRIREAVELLAGEFILGSTIEEFNMPNDMQAHVYCKSTWARRGLFVFNTVIDPGWRGFLTVELCNHSYEPILIGAGDPIAQVVFQRLELPTDSPYKGKYQDQEAGPQGPRFD